MIFKGKSLKGMVREYGTTHLTVFLLMAFACFVLSHYEHCFVCLQLQRYRVISQVYIFLGVGLLTSLKVPNGFSLVVIYSSLHLQKLAQCMAQSWANICLTKWNFIAEAGTTGVDIQNLLHRVDCALLSRCWTLSGKQKLAFHLSSVLNYSQGMPSDICQVHVGCDSWSC